LPSLICFDTYCGVPATHDVCGDPLFMKQD
jgi:hypothetical protein